jgi:hypothetical protein
MLRRLRFFLFAFFLVAIAGNFIKAAQISVNKADPSERSLQRGTLDTEPDDSAFIVPDDEGSDDAPVLVLTQATIENIQSAFLSARLTISTAITAARSERNHTVLTL